MGRVTPSQVEQQIRADHRVGPESGALLEHVATLRRRQRQLVGMLCVVVALCCMSMGWCMVVAPRYQDRHGEASIRDLTTTMVFSLSPAEQKQAADLLEVRARDAIRAIHEAASRISPADAAARLARIRKELDR